MCYANSTHVSFPTNDMTSAHTALKYKENISLVYNYLDVIVSACIQKSNFSFKLVKIHSCSSHFYHAIHFANLASTYHID